MINSGRLVAQGDYQNAEKVRQHRSRIVQTLNVPLRVRLRPSLAAALLDSLFEHSAQPAKKEEARRSGPLFRLDSVCVD
jgi:hypothetical protein